jgi:hypothetical protein
VLIAMIAAATERIRVGSGGVMLPNHAPLVVAEQFALLEAAYPGRIDLGIGRAPGTDPVTSWALRHGAGGVSDDAVTQFPQYADDIVAMERLVAAASWSIVNNSDRTKRYNPTTVRALQSCGFETIAAGDSYNDLQMIRASKAGFLFRSTEQIKKDNPDIPAFETYDDFLAAILKNIG